MTERGAAGIVALAVAATALMLVIVVVDTAGLIGARLRAVNAAESAALAAAPVTFRPFGAVPTPSAAAEESARSNRARLVACTCRLDRSWSPRRVEVVVETEAALVLLGTVHVRAGAAAVFVPSRLFEE